MSSNTSSLRLHHYPDSVLHDSLFKVTSFPRLRHPSQPLSGYIILNGLTVENVYNNTNDDVFNEDKILGEFNFKFWQTLHRKLQIRWSSECGSHRVPDQPGALPQDPLPIGR